MTKYFQILALVSSLFLASCSDDDDEPKFQDLTLNINGLENLGSDYVYEGWLIVDGAPITTGRFSVNDEGELSQQNFSIDFDNLQMATTFVLTIEPVVGDVPAPSAVHILAGDFVGENSQLTISHGAALGNNFTNSSGNYILATPTNGANNNENSGIWFLDLSSGAPAVGLNLPTLPDGWKYEGWAVIDGRPVTTGTFTMVDSADDFDGFSGDMSGPPFPGEDFLQSAPTGLTFPTDIAGGKAVISIEPSPDNSPAPFLLKPLVGDIPVDAMDHTTYAIEQNLSFPTGTATR